MPCSMTGFARKEAQHTWGTLSCEVRSVNHRYLEPTFRLPETLRALEPALREKLKNTISRGKLEVSIQLKTETASTDQLELNTELAQSLNQIAQHLKQEMQSAAELNPLELLRWPGMIKSAEVDPETLKSSAFTLYEEVLELLVENRKREGEELKKFIEQRIDEVAEKVSVVRSRMPEILKLHREKLKTKLESLSVDMDEDRFNQEAVYIAQKADVAEELDRLEAHITEAQHTLKQNNPIGRRLDFLMQEFNREANTLSSKSMASDTTQIAVDLKVLIEQMREQVQNIE